jgi:hypothetical protein
MRRLTRFATTAAAVVVATPAALFTIGTGAAGATPPDGSGGTTFLPFAQILRRCDFSANTYTGPTGYAVASGFLRTAGSSRVVAEVHIATARPNTHYDVRLIQMPRPSSSTCLARDPGVALGALNTDAAGAASVTVEDGIEPGATGAWVFITRPDAFSQIPAEFYTTDVIAPI